MTEVFVVSVVLNDQAGLLRTAASVLGQVGADVTWLIADGGSSDGSAALAQDLAGRDRKVRFLAGPDRGIYHGMNRALELVPEEALVWFLNAGDFFLSERSISKAVANTPPMGWSGGPMVLIGKSGAIHDVTSVPTLTASRGRPGLHLPAQPTILMAKSICREAGPFREDLRYAADGAFYQSVAKFTPPAVREEPLVAFALGGRSSRHYRETLMEFWSAGFRPTRWTTRLVDRELGQVRTWLRTIKLGISQRAGSDHGAHRGGALPFEHWVNHDTSGPGLACCLRMGQDLLHYN